MSLNIIFAAVLLIANAGISEGAAGQPQSFTVSLEYFSGLDSPTWVIDSKDPNFGKIAQKYQALTKENKLVDVAYMPAKLGYRGFIVNDGFKDVLALGRATIGFQNMLLDSMPRDKMSRDVLQMVTGALKLGVEPEKTRQRRAVLPQWPPVDIDWKNVVVKKCNNCYNYAVDVKLPIRQRFGVPGKGGNQMGWANPLNFQLTANNIEQAAYADRLVQINQPAPGVIPQIPAQQANSRHLVALVVDPGVDFHWYRLDVNANGRWSHKPGSTAVTNKDGAGNFIQDPRNAANAQGGPNYQFVCYMQVVKGVLKVEGMPDDDCQ